VGFNLVVSPDRQIAKLKTSPNFMSPLGTALQSCPQTGDRN